MSLDVAAAGEADLPPACGIVDQRTEPLLDLEGRRVHQRALAGERVERVELEQVVTEEAEVGFAIAIASIAKSAYQPMMNWSATMSASASWRRISVFGTRSTSRSSIGSPSATSSSQAAIRKRVPFSSR